MKNEIFQKLREINDKDLTDLIMYTGQNFLWGENVIKQKKTKKIGDPITYYTITSKLGYKLQYKEVLDKLEE